MSKCSQCDTNISFMSVLNTINPFKVKCSGCKKPIYIDKVTGGVAILLLLVITTPFLVLFYGADNYWLYTVLPIFVASEVIYFTLIKFNIVKLKPE